MKHTLLALALVASFGSAFAHGSSASVTGSNSVTSQSGSSVSVNGSGSAFSQSANVGYASTAVKSGGSAGSTGAGQANGGNAGYTFVDGASTYNTSGKFGDVTIGGTTETYNSSFVKTVTTGSGLAAGAASGVASAQAAGQGEFHTEGTGPKGSVNGASNALTASGVGSFQNGTATREAGMLSTFGASAAANITFQNTKDAAGVSGRADIKNASSSEFANAFSTVPTVQTQSGTAGGYLINTGSARASAESSVAGQVSASHK